MSKSIQIIFILGSVLSPLKQMTILSRYLSTPRPRVGHSTAAIANHISIFMRPNSQEAKKFRRQYNRSFYTLFPSRIFLAKLIVYRKKLRLLVET